MSETRLTIAQDGEYTPEEIREGLASGRFKAVDPDGKINLAAGGEYVAIPRHLMDHTMPSIEPDGITLKLPPGGVEHRILDHVSTTPKTFPQGRAFLHRAHHFAMGVEASQQLLLLAAESDWLEAHAEFAPHPFDEYTVSLWTGSPEGMAEVLVSVMLNGHGDHIANIVTLYWDSNRFDGYDGAALPRDLANASDSHTLAWRFCDAFRLLLAQPRRVVVNHGPGNRHAIRKGRRVTFYSKSEIKIDLDAVPKIIQAHRTGNGRMMPAYQYRAHLCHSGGTKGCGHSWTLDPERETPFWTCDKCGRRRWQRRAGQRGSAEVGFVRQTYKVVKGND